VNLALRAGSHELRIIASTDNIAWSEPTVLRIYKKEKLSEKAYFFWLAALAALGLVILASYMIIRRVRINARRRLLEEQQVNLLKHQAMNALLSPHFIFNSLTSIQNYINTNNSLKASEYLAKFSRLIRMIIEKAGQSTISLHDELARLTYYLELEKERFKNKFEYVIHIDENINTHGIMIPNMIIQPHVENCILHGILPKHEPGRLEISFQKPTGNSLLILIQDDGIGLIKAAEHAKTGHKSLGISTIRNILEINSKLSGNNQKMTMVDRSTLDPSLQGTLITIELELG
jgi:LytS/YehU family sensor histidine kinase